MKKIVFLLALCSIFILPFTMNNRTVEASEQEIYFVDTDADYNTAYYIDVSSIKFDSYCTFRAKLNVIRAREKLLFVYDTRFDLEIHSYQYMSTEIYKYEGKEFLSRNNKPNEEQDYLVIKPVGSVVDFAMDWQRRHREIVVPAPPIPEPPDPEI